MSKLPKVAQLRQRAQALAPSAIAWENVRPETLKVALRAAFRAFAEPFKPPAEAEAAPEAAGQQGGSATLG